MEKLYPIREGNKWGCMNGRGQVVIEPKFDEVNAFDGGLAAVKIKNKFGFIDKAGRVVIDFRFRTASAFADGLSFFELPDGRVGYIDKKGKYIWEPTV